MLVIGQPHRVMTKAKRIAAIPDPLPEYLVGFSIDGSERDTKYGRPDEARTPSDVAAMTRNTDCDGRDYFSALRLDTRNASIALVQSPDRTSADSEKPGIGTDRDRG